jgi:spore photoproduct lyase
MSKRFGVFRAYYSDIAYCNNITSAVLLSAHYQLPLVSGCPGHCQYCYLNTNLGKNPFVKVYANIDEILGQAEEYVDRRKPEVTVFEGSATSDPVAVESWTGSLQETIRFIATLGSARFRFATKYGYVQNLLKLEHNGKTEVRFSINSDYVVRQFEAGTPPLENRLKAARKISLAGYPLGFLIGPIIHFPDWRSEYMSLLDLTRAHIPEGVPVSFELCDTFADYYSFFPGHEPSSVCNTLMHQKDFFVSLRVNTYSRYRKLFKSCDD